MAFKIVVVVMVLAATSAHAADAGVAQVLVIDAAKGTTDPPMPIVNVVENQSIVVRLADPHMDGRLSVEVGANSSEFSSASTIILNFEDGARLSARPIGGNNVWRVTAPSRSVIGVKLRRPNDKDGNALPEQVYPIQIESKPWFLEFSAGFAFLTDPNRKSYRLVPDAAGSANLQQTGSCGWSTTQGCGLSYQFTAFVHAIPLKVSWLGLSLGLGTSVPISDISLLAGIDLRARSFPITNDAFFTFGVAFTPSLRMPAGSTDVSHPVEMKVGDLYEKPYDWGLFVAMSFGFFGGEDSIKGLYPGKK